MMMSRCDPEALARAVERTAEPEEAAAVEAHVGKCSACARRRAKLVARERTFARALSESSATSCPTDEALAAYASGGAPRELASIEEHLLGCDECRFVLIAHSARKDESEEELAPVADRVAETSSLELPAKLAAAKKKKPSGLSRRTVVARPSASPLRWFLPAAAAGVIVWFLLLKTGSEEAQMTRRIAPPIPPPPAPSPTVAPAPSPPQAAADPPEPREEEPTLAQTPEPLPPRSGGRPGGGPESESLPATTERSPNLASITGALEHSRGGTFSSARGDVDLADGDAVRALDEPAKLAIPRLEVALSPRAQVTFVSLAQKIKLGLDRGEVEVVVANHVRNTELVAGECVLQPWGRGRVKAEWKDDGLHATVITGTAGAGNSKGWVTLHAGDSIVLKKGVSPRTSWQRKKS